MRPIRIAVSVLAMALTAGCATQAPRATVGAVSDYFATGVVLGGHRQHSFETSLYDIPFYPAAVRTAASAATRDEALIRVVSTGAELWTPYVIESVPADPEALAVGTFVFYVGDADARTTDELAAMSEWRFGRVKDLSGLFRGVVVVEYRDGYWNEWRQWDIHAKNLRLVTSEVTPEF